MGARRISAEEALREVDARQALLVCGYADEAKCAAMRVGDALTFAEFHQREPSLPKDTRLLFYCA